MPPVFLPLLPGSSELRRSQGLAVHIHLVIVQPCLLVLGGSVEGWRPAIRDARVEVRRYLARGSQGKLVVHRHHAHPHCPRHGRGALLHFLSRDHCTLSHEGRRHLGTALSNHGLLLLIQGRIDGPPTCDNRDVLPLRQCVRNPVFSRQRASADGDVAVPEDHIEAAAGAVRRRIARRICEFLGKAVINIFHRRLHLGIVSELGVRCAGGYDLAGDCHPLRCHPDHARNRSRGHSIVKLAQNRFEHGMLGIAPLGQPLRLRL
mmetsp:Transcript_36385/g.77482  ORF Transcript_36385/g.77482 Transcript_36385/m.77482 type:complete len:262 (+) Transcript_36385:30-815(+)